MNCWNQQCDTSRVNISQLHSLSSNSPLPVAGRHKQAHLLSTTIPWSVFADLQASHPTNPQIQGEHRLRVSERYVMMKSIIV